MIKEDNLLKCSVCEDDYTHLVTTLKFEDDDHYKTTKVTVNSQYEIPCAVEYRFRSQGNIHLVFICEEGHYFIKSFDGHKGNVLVDENPLIDDLSRYLNENNNQDEMRLNFDFKLLGQIESFLNEI